MGKVKSIRFNDRTEKMFNVVKSYYSKRGSISDSEIISNGIEMQYDQVSSDMNDSFRETMSSWLTNNMFGCEAFKQLCDMLEILSVSHGSLLQDEFWYFLMVNVDSSSVYNVDGEEKELVNKQYEKIYDTMLKGFDESSFEDALSKLNEIFYQSFGEEYERQK